MTVLPTPIYGSSTASPGSVIDSTRRSASSTGNWHGWIVFSGWLFLTFGNDHTSLGFLPFGLPESLPAFGPLKCRLWGYFDGTRMLSRFQV